MVGMNADQVAALSALLGPSGWLEQTDEFARALRVSARTPGGLLLVGTPDDEPWHLTAHLADESDLARLARAGADAGPLGAAGGGAGPSAGRPWPA